MPEIIDFGNLAPVEIPVMLNGTRYILTEASGDAAIRYRTAQLPNLRYTTGDGNKAECVGESSKQIEHSKAILISGCLYKTGPSGELIIVNGIPNQSMLVDERTIRGWPVRVLDQLYKKILEISDGLEEVNENKAKNS